MGTGNEKEHFLSGFSEKIQSRPQIKCFITAKQIVCNRPLQTLPS